MPTVEQAGLLSRVADTLYWIGRYLERAEHNARLLDVHSTMALDATATRTEWQQLIDMARDGGEYPANWPVDPTWVARFVVHYAGNPNAIVACLTVARENARGVRGTISSELWEQINGLYWQVKSDVENGTWLSHTHQFLQSVKQGSHLFHGLAEETMLHDEGGAFLRLGKYLERCVNTLKLVEVKHPGLNAEEGEPDLIRCAATLKMCSAFEAYRRYYAAPVEPTRVVEFLLLNPTFPRSALWAAARAAEESRTMARGAHASRQPERLLGQLRSVLEYAHVDDVLSDGLASFVRTCREQTWNAEQSLSKTFFLRDERPLVPGRPSFAPQQQQQ